MAKRPATGALVPPSKTDSQPTLATTASLRVLPGAERKQRYKELDANHAKLGSGESPPSPGVTSVGALMAARVTYCDAAAHTATLTVGNRELSATLAPEVDPVVIHRAVERGEHVIAQQEGAEVVILGVLRTSATPGLDVGDDYTIEARRVRIKAEHELSLSSGMARIALASLGRIESIAQFITSRASVVHKIIGRAIELN